MQCHQRAYAGSQIHMGATCNRRMLCGGPSANRMPCNVGGRWSQGCTSELVMAALGAET
jgi:hypothetical protein